MMTVAVQIVVSCLLVTGTPLSQEKPNFAGTWTPITGVNPKTELIVTQTATRLTVRAGDEPEHQGQIPLDGTEVKQGAGDVTTKARWDGSKLVVTNTFRAQGAVISVQTQVWSLDSEGLLVIETIRERDGKPTQTVKSTYGRK